MNVSFVNSKHKSARLAGLVVCFALIGQHASALSCMKPNLAQSFNHYADAEETFVIAKGTIRYTEPVPKYKQGKPRSVRAELSGGLLGLSGFGEDQSVPITVKTDCIHVWCGAMPRPNQEIITFLEKTPAGYVMTNGACPGVFQPDPSDREIRIVQSCLKRGACRDRDINALEKERR